MFSLVTVMTENTANIEPILNPKYFQKSFTLSQEGDKHALVIDKNIIQQCERHDIYILDFLYRSYKNELNGVILNVEGDFNPQLQVSVFLGALSKSLKNQFLVLIVCPDESLVKWHYFLTTCGFLQVKLVTEENCEDLYESKATALLLSFSNIKLGESLLVHDFVSVVVDKHDQIASKMVMRKFQGNFNIGITFRNFYTEPDQKLQWTMLNWANSGCVGKLANFYEIDNENFSQFRDNYKEWWFRLTWSFSDSFVRPTLEEKGNLSSKLREWAKDHNLHNYCLAADKISTKKRQRNPAIKSKTCSNEDDVPKKVNKKTTKKKPESKVTKENNKKLKDDVEHMEIHNDNSNSSDTVIYGNLLLAELDDKTAKLMGKEGTCEKQPHLPAKENCPIQKDSKLIDNMEVSDDASDMFLKSVTCKSDMIKDLARESELFVSRLLTKETSENSCTNLQVEVGSSTYDLSTESDSFLEEICGQKSKTVEYSHIAIPNDNYSGLSEAESDVDKLIAEAMEVVTK